jgi:serine/threonine-protein kinase
MIRAAILFFFFFSGLLFTLEAKRFFPDDNIWYQDITNAPLDPESDEIINWLANNGGWGNGNRFQVDYSSLHILYVVPGQTRRAPIIRAEGYYRPDCDTTARRFPLPPRGAVEGMTDYYCDVGNGDCHLLVVDEAMKILWESYQTTIDDEGNIHSRCIIKWDMCRTYPANQRGEQCTSADAAGLPITPLMFTADEIAAGMIDHPIRITLPNDRIRASTYVHPASHAGGPRAPAPAPIYGGRFRLKASFDDSRFTPPAKVVIKALKQYGMILADGGEIVLTAATDMFTEHKYEALGFDSHSMFGIEVREFEVIDGGERIDLTYDCVLNDLPKDSCDYFRERFEDFNLTIPGISDP